MVKRGQENKFQAGKGKLYLYFKYKGSLVLFHVRLNLPAIPADTTNVDVFMLNEIID